MRLSDLAHKILKSATPRYAYNPQTIQLNDGLYIFRMAPFTNVNSLGGVWFPDVNLEENYSNQRSNPKAIPAIQEIERILLESKVVDHLDELSEGMFSFMCKKRGIGFSIKLTM